MKIKTTILALVALLVSSMALADNVLPPSTKDVPNGYVATLTWGAVTQGVIGDTLTPPITYNVYAVTTTTTTKITTVSTLTYKPPALTGVGQQCWGITAVALVTEGGMSNFACLNVLPLPPPVPKAPTGLGVN